MDDDVVVIILYIMDLLTEIISQLGFGFGFGKHYVAHVIRTWL